MLLQELASSSLWDTAVQMNLLQDRLNRLFSLAPESRQADFPPINIWESEQKVVVLAEVPGIEPENIDLQIVNNTLTLKTKRAQDQLQEGQALHRQERGYGQFSRSLELPFAIDAEMVKASSSQGVLRVELPRASVDLPKKISIQAS